VGSRLRSRPPRLRLGLHGRGAGFSQELESGGVEADLKLKEMGAFISSTIFGKFEKMMTTIRGGALFPTHTSPRFIFPDKPSTRPASMIRSSTR